MYHNWGPICQINFSTVPGPTKYTVRDHGSTVKLDLSTSRFFSWLGIATIPYLLANGGIGMFILRRFLISTFILLLWGSSQCFSLDPYTVRTVYFIPSDSDDRSDWLDLDDIMKSTQSIYRDEMHRHGFPNKTFRLELDDKGDVVVHKIRSNHNKAYYFHNTMAIVRDELRLRFDKRNIYVVVMAGMNAFQSGGAAGVATAHPGGWWDKGEDHGYALSTETTRDTTEQVILHELGHTFGLLHIRLYNPKDYILGSGRKLAEHEARWLSKMYYFNDVWRFGFAPSIGNVHDVELIDEDNVRFRLSLSDNNGLHQVYIGIRDYVIGWKFLDGQHSDISAFDVNRQLVLDESSFWIRAMDSHGNWLYYDRDYVLPEVPVSETDNGIRYLTLKDKRSKSLTPVNNEIQWFGWANAGIYEKQPGRLRQHLPNWYFNVPILDEWDSWIYSHAISTLVYNVSEGEYNRFVADLYLPNPRCVGTTASIQILILADGERVYRSGVLRAPDAQNKRLSVDFPSDTEQLTIQITDAIDGITCDHFILGNAQVLTVEIEPEEDIEVVEDQDPEDIDIVEPDDIICEDCDIVDNTEETDDETDLSVNAKGKLTTTWADIKLMK